MGKIGAWVLGAGLAGILLVSGCSPQPPAEEPLQARVTATVTKLPAVADTIDEEDTTTPEELTTTGIATYLSDEFHGEITASGVPYDKDALVAAHKSLPFNTTVLVTNLASGKTVTVVIIDRMPERVESIIDVSSAAAADLGMLEAGEAEVSIRVVND